MITIIEVLVFLLFTFPSCLAQETNVSDYKALLAFKSNLILESINILSSNWSSNTHFCNWLGVSCSNSPDKRVVALQLRGLALRGIISPEIANLTRLLVLDLSSNDLGGTVPSELGLLLQLRLLNLTGNFLQGSIPANISHCQKLEELCISNNMITGSIPEELGLLSNLKALRLNDMNLTGNVPASLGNLSNLQYFYLHENTLLGDIPAEIGKLSHLTLLSFRGNNFTGSLPPLIFNISALQIIDFSINGLSGQLPENLGHWLPNLESLFVDSNRITGRIPVSLSNASKLNNLFLTENNFRGNIPSELGRLLQLEWLELEYNQLSNNTPSSIFNISSLQILEARHNYLSGQLPDDLGLWLPNLQEIYLSHNLFSGEIAPSICNASKLVYLEMSNNSFSGPIPMMLGKLVNLEHLNLQNNLLTSEPQSTHLDFLNSLVNSRNLEYLILGSNPLNGILPDSIGNLSSNLRVIAAESCQIKGSIPRGLGNLSSLSFLGLANNDLEGNIPPSFVGLLNLERLYLTGNNLKGPISAELCSIKSLGILHLGENMLSGSIPIFIKNLTELVEFSLAANSFNSNIPLSFWRLVKLESLNLSRTSLHGFIPPEMGNLKAVRIMDLSSSNFSGDIPNSLGSLQNLVSLDMSRNSFQGPIPDSVRNLIVLESLDLSSNVLSGMIPKALESMQDLKYLNLSFNRLHGEIPQKGVFLNLSYQSLMGNPQICGAPRLGLPSCPTQTSNRRRRTSHVLKITIPIIATFLLVVICCLTWISFYKKKVEGNTAVDSSPRMGHQIITYHELVRATAHFSEANLIGSGSSSMVYKGTLADGTVAAIKVLNMQSEGALKNFNAECEIMCNARHRNLVKIISTCSNMDFKAMVLEFMPNGTLDKWLHSHNNHLNLIQRIDIVTDVALAMEYLHHECTVPIVHCDLKPSNVLLDEEMTAHVADYGISKVLAQDQAMTQTRTLGTIGYIAPEYGLDGHVSTRADVYSFGILLLETFTRKKPTDDMFRGDLSLHQWVNRFFPDSVKVVLDSSLSSDMDFKKESSSAMLEQSLVSIIHVALQCLKESPEERINMRDVGVQLKKIRTESHQYARQGNPKFSNPHTKGL
ncbi:unnamed protein product [Ilex paraguariensis]|uniref:non-specific serine/threonine protein kinase n=1 Tax=Ilex paraguariensis TaxID=185542 RepID=A0ABC8S3T1_9AQUA